MSSCLIQSVLSITPAQAPTAEPAESHDEVTYWRFENDYCGISFLYPSDLIETKSFSEHIPVYYSEYSQKDNYSIDEERNVKIYNQSFAVVCGEGNANDLISTDYAAEGWPAEYPKVPDDTTLPESKNPNIEIKNIIDDTYYLFIANDALQRDTHVLMQKNLYPLFESSLEILSPASEPSPAASPSAIITE